MKKETMISRKMKICSISFWRWINNNACAILITIFTLLGFLIRYLVVQYPTNDVVGFILNGWMKSMLNVGFKNFYTVDADYSPLYLFTINVIAHTLPKGPEVTVNGYTYYLYWMYYLKSIFFLTDLLTAIACYLIVKRITGSKTYAAIAYIVSFFLPVQFVNSAMWGNCDSLYFCVFAWMIYAILRHHDFVVYFLLGLGLSIKLQAVFIIPFICYLIASHRMRLYPIFMLPIAILLSFVPSYICGAPLAQPFEYFTTQLNRYSQLTLGCANFWKFFPAVNKDTSSSVVNSASTIIGLSFIAVLTAIVYFRRIRLDDRSIVIVATFLMAIVPFFLPHMHERYMYVLEAMAIVYCLVRKGRYWFIPLTQISGSIAYYHYMSGFKIYIFDILGEDSVTIGAGINLLVLCFMFYDILSLPHMTKEEYNEEMNKRIEALKETDKEILTKNLDA